MDKKALIVTQFFHPEEFVINDLIDSWIEKGFELEILTTNPSYPSGKVSQGFKNRIYHKSKYKSAIIHRFLFIPGYQNHLIFKMLNYINYMILSFWILIFIGKRFDRIFIYQAGPLSNAFSPVLLKPIFKYKLTIWIQDLWPDTIYAYGLPKNSFTHYILTRFVRFIYSGFDTILISCEGFKERIETILKKPKPIFWIPNWSLTNTNGNTKEKVRLPNGFNFTFAGNIGKVQNLDNVVCAFKSVAEVYPKANLNIIGDGSFLEELKSICSDEKIANINFTGRHPVSKMPKYFAASDVLLISLVDVPLYEIMIPSKFQAYLTAKKPIYAVMKGEVVNMVSQYNLGISAPPSSIEEIENGFIQFLDYSDKELNDFSNNSVQLLNHRFSEEKTIKKISSLFWNDKEYRS